MTTCIVSSGIGSTPLAQHTRRRMQPDLAPYAEHAWRAQCGRRRIHRIPSKVAGTQFCLDAYSHGNKSYRGFKYYDMFTDLNTGRVYPVFTKDRGAEELCHRSAILFDSHPEWRSTGSDGDRFMRVDPELSYRSTLFMQHASKYGYRIEPTPTRDKHANGVAERTIAAIASKTTLAMLDPSHVGPFTPSTEQVLGSLL
jgi:hypothetical protein